ncbi:hypothetical protein Tco_1475227 [Tanacetum coccineum]
MSNTNTNLQTQTSSVLHNDTVSSCSTSKVQEKTQLSRSRCMNSLREVKSQFKFLTETLQDFGTMPIFKRTFSQDLDLLEQHLTKDILSQTDCNTTLTKLITKFENSFNSEFKELLSKEDLKGTRIEHGFKQAFMSLFGQDNDTFTSTMLLNVDQLQKQLDKDKFQEDGSMAAFWMQTQDSKVDMGKALDADLVVIESNGTESEVQDDSSRLENDTDADDAYIIPIYDEKPLVEVQLTAEYNIFATGKQHTEQPEIINESRVDQYTKNYQVKSPLLNSSPDNKTTEFSNQSLESENIFLKNVVAKFQKDFSRMEAHCIALELKYQNQALKSGQHGQNLNETSNKSKIKKEIDVLETMNIELEHSVDKLLKENETLKKHYKDLYDSIKITRSKTIEQTTSLLANNADLEAQIQEKVFAIAALKNNIKMSNTNTNLQTQTSSVIPNDTVSSCSTSKVQDKTQLLRSRCMNNLREVKSQFKFLTETLQDFGTMPIFKKQSLKMLLIQNSKSTQESKVDMGKALDADLVVTESSGTESKVQDDCSRSENDTDADDAYIIPIYD